MSKETRITEKLELIIPGFKGYKQKELIREDDRLVRNYLYNTIKNAEDTIRSYLPAALEGKIPLSVSDLNNLAKDLNSIGTKIRAAPSGYSGYFDRVKITENELSELKKLDEELVSTCEEVLSLAKKILETPSLLAELRNKISLLNSSIDKRNSIFKTSRGE